MEHYNRIAGGVRRSPRAPRTRVLGRSAALMPLLSLALLAGCPASERAALEEGSPRAVALADLHYARGLLAEDSRDHGGARFHFARAVRLDPERARTYYHLGINRFAASNRRFPHTLESPYQTLAAMHYSKALQLDPSLAPAFEARAWVRLAQKAMRMATADFLQAAALDTDLLSSFDDTTWMTRDAPAAIEYFTQQVELRPGEALMWFERGNAHAAQREYDEALADWEQALELSPGLPPVLLARADLRTHTGELEAAEEDLEAVLEVLPDYPVTYRLLGWCRYLAGDFEAAVAAFTRSLEERPKDRRTLVRRGLARWELGRSELALADFAAAHRANPERLFEIGAPVRLATEPGAALERYRQRLEADGDDPASWLLVANALQRLGRLDEAEAALGSALELAPTSALARLERGVLRQRLGRSAEALEDFDAALAEDGGLARALNNRGILRAEAGELEAARADYEAASEADPTFAWPLANLALLLAEREPTAALALLGRALDLSPDYADAYEARAVLYDRAGNHPAARRDRELAGRARGE